MYRFLALNTALILAVLLLVPGAFAAGEKGGNAGDGEQTLILRKDYQFTGECPNDVEASTCNIIIESINKNAPVVTLGGVFFIATNEHVKFRHACCSH